MSDEQFNRMIELLEDIRKWTKFQGWRKVKEVLLDTLKEDEDKLVYHYSNGRSSREVAERTPVSQFTVVKRWAKWARIGIVEPVQVQRGTRYMRIFPLEVFGIEIPHVPSPTQSSSASNEASSEQQEKDGKNE